MSAADAYAAMVDAAAAQQARLGVARADRWSHVAHRFRDDPRRPLDETLRCLAGYVQPDDVLIDVGGGAGRIGLPLALRCRELVNVEPAAGMREEFSAAAAEAGIANVRSVPAAWPDADVVGDVVLTVDVTYFVREIGPFLAKLDAAARRRALIVIGSVPPPVMNARLFQLVLGEEQAPAPGHRELLPVLWELGLLPEVRVLAASPMMPDRPQADRTAAVQAALASGLFAGDERAARIVQAHFDELFTRTPQGYVPAWRPQSRTMVITWETERGPTL